MPPGRTLSPLLACLFAAGCVAPGMAVETASVETPLPLEPFAVDWRGHVAHSATDAFLHLSPTDALLWPYEQAGFVLDVPEGVKDLEIAVAWEGPADFWIHTHSHEPTEEELVSFRSEFGRGNPHCIRIPSDSVVPGHWMIMAHSRDAVRTDYTITILTSGEPAIIEDEYHGHKDWTELLTMVERDAETCTLWQPPA